MKYAWLAYVVLVILVGVTWLSYTLFPTPKGKRRLGHDPVHYKTQVHVANTEPPPGMTGNHGDLWINVATQESWMWENKWSLI